VGERKKSVGAAVMAVDARIAKAPIAFVAGVAGPIAGVRERMAHVTELTFLKP
jgi:hypothetical protein